MYHQRNRIAAGLVVACLVTLGACGSGSAERAVGDRRPTIVVTTSILADVVGEVVGNQADVVTLMPVGADPHDFQLSAQETDRLLSADALVVNGAGFEEGLLDVIESAEADGVPVFEAVGTVSALPLDHGGHGHDDDGHDDGDHDDDGDHHDDQDGDVDPHFFTDPLRMADAVDGLVEFLIDVVDIDRDALEQSAADYTDALRAADADVRELVDQVDPGSRVLVTSHAVLGYFADRYGFEVVGAVIPDGSTTGAASAGELAALAETVEVEGVPAIFTDSSSSVDLIDALADEVSGVEVVELYTESLGEPGSDGATYLEMLATNAERITDALR